LAVKSEQEIRELTRALNEMRTEQALGSEAPVSDFFCKLNWRDAEAQR